MGIVRCYTPSILLDERQIELLRSAESQVEEFYCLNGCRRHVKFKRCAECPGFAPASDGQIACDGYESPDDGRRRGGDGKPSDGCYVYPETRDGGALKGPFSLGM